MDNQTSTTTILVVDDDAFVRAALIPALAKGGYSVIAAEGGPQGIERFAANAGRIDLVVADITMPEMDGVKMVEQIRMQRADVPVLFMSGRGDALPSWACETCGFLLKPFRIPQLLAAVNACLDSTVRPKVSA